MYCSTNWMAYSTNGFCYFSKGQKSYNLSASSINYHGGSPDHQKLCPFGLPQILCLQLHISGLYYHPPRLPSYQYTKSMCTLQGNTSILKSSTMPGSTPPSFVTWGNTPTQCGHCDVNIFWGCYSGYHRTFQIRVSFELNFWMWEAWYTPFLNKCYGASIPMLLWEFTS